MPLIVLGEQISFSTYFLFANELLKVGGAGYLSKLSILKLAESIIEV